MSTYNEDAYEHALIEMFRDNMGWEHVYGPDIDRDWHSPLFDSVLEDSIRRLNPTATLCSPHEAGVACSTAKALEWDEAWKNAKEPSGRAIGGVHDKAY